MEDIDNNPALGQILGNFDKREDVDQNEIRSQLSTMSFEDLQKLKAELGTKLYKEAYYGNKNVKQTTFKRLNKNRPREASSKIKPKLMEPKKKSNVRDPRFDSLCGSFDKAEFEKNYDFISDMQKEERKKLKNMLKKEKHEGQVNKIKYLLQRMDNQERERLRREKEQARKITEKKEMIEALKTGKRPHFKSKYEKRIGEIVEKYQELKESGKLLKYIERRQKKNNKKYKPCFSQD